MQELPGNDTEVELRTPSKITAAEETALTEDRVPTSISPNPFLIDI
jgi:hypothetical protein